MDAYLLPSDVSILYAGTITIDSEKNAHVAQIKGLEQIDSGIFETRTTTRVRIRTRIAIRPQSRIGRGNSRNGCDLVTPTTIESRLVL